MDRPHGFGSWLKQRRKALDLTQDALAQQAGCTATTIRRIEAGTRRPSRQIAERLLHVLAIAPEDQLAIVGFARGTLPAPSSRRSTNLPVPATRLIGRAEQLALIQRQLLRDDARLLTLTGPPGIGKTHLSLEASAQLADAFADGVYVVELAPIRDPALVTTAIAQVLGLKEVGTQPLLVSLTAYLRDRELLLVLDNFEHLLAAAPLISDLLRASPWVRIVVTSRAALRLRGERQFPVPPLKLPDRADLSNMEVLAQSPAVALFAERAQAIQPAFALTAANAAAVVAICHHLDGLPLAIELAAARITLFAPETLLARLDRRLVLLTDGARDLPERQQTLRAAIDWSYHLLDVREQQLFAWLAVFVGGWTLEAAEAIGKAAIDVAIDTLDGMATLVGHNLLRQHEGVDGLPRFTMLETIREYALERMAASGMAETIQHMHAGYYLALVEAGARSVEPPPPPSWFQEISTEYDNLRTALAWSLDRGKVETALRLGVALGYFWQVNGYWSEGRGWLETAVRQSQPMLTEGMPVEPLATLQAEALRWASWLARLQGDLGTARAWGEQALAGLRRLGDTRRIAGALTVLASVVSAQGDLTTAWPMNEEALALFEALGERNGVATILNNMGWQAHLVGDDRAQALLEESLTVWSALGQTNIYTLHSLGLVVLERGELARARELLITGMREAWIRRNKEMLANYLEGFAWLATPEAALHDRAAAGAQRAARCFGAAEVLREEIGSKMDAAKAALHARHVSAARAHLDQVAWELAWAAGRALTLDEAVFAEAFATVLTATAVAAER